MYKIEEENRTCLKAESNISHRRDPQYLAGRVQQATYYNARELGGCW